VEAGGWDRDLFRGNELHRKTAGIVGLGRVGRMVAGYLQALGMTVIASDPAPARPPQAGIKLLPLAQLLERADLVTLHVSLSDQTTGFFGEREFKRMRAGAWFINTSRGELVDEKALLHALASDRLAGAALDVISHENSAGMSGHPLVTYARTHRNLLITPHIGGCTAESMEKTEIFLADKVAAALDAHPEAVLAGEKQNEGSR
jgi:D-3-phosphoglycerate dehydrogenase